MQGSFDELYANQNYANEITIHTMRDGGKWSDPFAFNQFYPKLKKINNEPPGPGSSAGGMHTTGADVLRDSSKTKKAGWPVYVGHSEWCVWNGHLPQKYHNGWREKKFVWELPNMPQCAAAMKAVAEGTSPGPIDPAPPNPEEPVIPYDENKSIEFGKACNDVYIQNNIPQDPGMISVHSQRAAWDYYSGTLPWDQSMKKHINELRDVYGLPHV
jgi:hypothetical protein